jgi:serine/threonine protein kinase
VSDLLPVASALARGPLPLAQSAKIIARVCQLLAPLHDGRRVHRAVSPDNVWFRHVGGELTVELRDTMLPTALYANPERIAGQPEGTSSDVYCLGVLFFHMITGVPPFEGGTEAAILEKHRTQGPPALAYNELQDVPLELEALVRAMLAKDPQRRPAVRKIAGDLANLDLDSTIMGVRIQEVLAQERGTDPQLIDPYGDTFIRKRSDFHIDIPDVETTTDTILHMEAPKKPSSGWNEADATRILMRKDEISLPPPAEPSEPAPLPEAQGSRLFFAFGLLFFLVAIVTAAIVVVQRS